MPHHSVFIFFNMLQDWCSRTPLDECTRASWVKSWNWCSYEYFTVPRSRTVNMLCLFESVLNPAASCAPLPVKTSSPTSHLSGSNSVLLHLSPCSRLYYYSFLSFLISISMLTLLSHSLTLAHLHRSSSLSAWVRFQTAEIKRAALLHYQAICPLPAHSYYYCPSRRDRGRERLSLYLTHLSISLTSWGKGCLCGSFRNKAHRNVNLVDPADQVTSNTMWLWADWSCHSVFCVSVHCIPCYFTELRLCDLFQALDPDLCCMDRYISWTCPLMSSTKPVVSLRGQSLSPVRATAHWMKSVRDVKAGGLKAQTSFFFFLLPWEQIPAQSTDSSQHCTLSCCIFPFTRCQPVI